MTNTPDFIIIGAMKSATSTLYEQLRLQPGIFVTDIKEPNFFSDDAQFANGENWYLNLFAPAASSDIIGEASTHYTKLPTYPETVQRMKKVLDAPKLIYVMRHPIERLISHYMHEWSEGTIRCEIDEAIVQHPRLVDYSCYARQLIPYFRQYGHGSVLPVFFEQLKLAPDDTLARICEFIGYRHQPTWHSDLSRVNVSAERIRKFAGYRLFIESRSATWIRRTLVPKAFRNRIKQTLTMTNEPALSPLSRQHLEIEFDRDLATLGTWLGVDINCGNFSEITASRPLNWSKPMVL